MYVYMLPLLAELRKWQPMQLPAALSRALRAVHSLRGDRAQTPLAERTRINEMCKNPLFR